MLHWLSNPARMQFCERAVAGPIQHPADTWTNIGPLVAGILILRRARRPLERLLGVAAVSTAVASAYFHATGTILGEAMDLGGMFMFILTVAALQQHRAWLERRSRACQSSSGQLGAGFGTNGQLIALVILLTLLLTVLSTFTILFASPTFGVIVLLVGLREVLSGHRLGRWGWALVVTFLIAWAAWWLDYLKILCYPSNHILTGHGVWHLLNGLVFWFTFLHYNSAEKHATELCSTQRGCPTEDGAQENEPTRKSR